MEAGPQGVDDGVYLIVAKTIGVLASRWDTADGALFGFSRRTVSLTIR